MKLFHSSLSASGGLGAEPRRTAHGVEPVPSGKKMRNTLFGSWVVDMVNIRYIHVSSTLAAAFMLTSVSGRSTEEAGVANL